MCGDQGTSLQVPNHTAEVNITECQVGHLVTIVGITSIKDVPIDQITQLNHKGHKNHRPKTTVIKS